MSTIRKHKKKYQVIIRRKDHPHIYKSFVSLEAAREWARETEVNIERGLYANLNAAMSMTLKALLEAYRDNVTCNKKGHKEESYKINKLIRHEISSSSLAKLTKLRLTKLQKELKDTHNPSTINKYISLISMALKYAVNDLEIYLPNNVASKVVRLTEPEYKGEVITKLEEAKLINNSFRSKAYWLRAALILGIDCGLRRSEINRLNINDIDKLNKTAILNNTKNGESRVIGLTTRALHEILKLPRTVKGDLFNWKSKDQFKFYWKQLKKWSGVNKTFHSTRATFCTRAAENNWQLYDIAAQSGHKDINVLKKHYVKLDAKHLSNKLNKYSG